LLHILTSTLWFLVEWTVLLPSLRRRREREVVRPCGRGSDSGRASEDLFIHIRRDRLRGVDCLGDAR
jgi:hypothetical protein